MTAVATPNQVHDSSSLWSVMAASEARSRKGLLTEEKMTSELWEKALRPVETKESDCGPKLYIGVGVTQTARK